MAKRKALSKRARFEVFKRDSFTCQYCGRTPPQVILEADHMVPLAEGGVDAEENLITACADCNRGKGAVPLSSVPANVDSRLAEKADRVKQLRAYNKFLMEARSEETEMVRALGIYWNRLADPGSKRDEEFDRARATSVRRFLRSLPLVEIYDSIDRAFLKRPAYHNDYATFKYFCGTCWGKIKDIEGGDA